jgi:cell division protease FtsH
VHAIDEEIRRLIDDNYERARNILNEKLEQLHAMADALIRYETIDDEQIRDIMAGRKPKPPQGWEDLGPPTSGAPTGEVPVPGPAVGAPASQT